MTEEEAVKVATIVPSPGAASTVLEREAVTPAGKPVTAKFTWLLKAPPCLLVTFTCAVLPDFNDSVDSDAERVNVDTGAVTVSGRDTV